MAFNTATFLSVGGLLFFGTITSLFAKIGKIFLFKPGLIQCPVEWLQHAQMRSLLSEGFR